MLVPIRYNKGAGNAAIFLRLRNATGQFWDFVGLGWLSAETADCRRFFTERADADADESLYTVTVTIPVDGPWIKEAVLAADNSLLWEPELTTLENVSADLQDIQATQADINTAVTLLLSNVATLLDIGQGNWQITGNQMIFSKRDGTELMRFDLTDKAGQPSETTVFQRVKV